MTKLIKGITFLRFFDGEGGAEGSNAASPTAQGENVASPTTQEVTEADRRKSYDEFKKQNKDFFEADIKAAMDKRFKSHKATEDELAKHKALVSVLYDKYHVDTLDALQTAMDADDSLVYELADEAGMTPEQYRKVYKLEKQNKELMAAEERRRADAEMGMKISAWRAEEQKLQAKYPGFSLDSEYENSAFRAVINTGASLEDAYRMIHFDDLMQANIEAQQKAMADNIRAKGNRPAENGTTANSAFTMSKKSARDLTDADIDELIARSRKGELISFG